MDISEIVAPRLKPKTLKEIDLFTEAFYPEAKKTGEQLAKHKLKNTQVRGLENIVVATTRFSEIVNYVKNQAGKEKKDNKWGKVAPIILGQLEKIEEKAAEIAPEDAAERLEVKLRLARGWARQAVAHYLYETREEGGGNDAG